MCPDQPHRPAEPEPAAAADHRNPSPPEGEAATAHPEPPRTDTTRPEKGEPEVPRPNSGPACTNSTEETHTHSTRPPERGRGNAQAHSGTTGGEPPTSRTDATTPAPPGRAKPGDLVEHLDDHDTGRWQISTEASLYLLDLDTRSFIRIPGAGPRADSQVIAVTDMPGDHRSLPLVTVRRCTLGHRMLLLSEPWPDGTVNHRHSTDVLEIRRLPDTSQRPEP